MDVDVFCVGMMLMFFGKGNGGLIVRKKSRCVELNTEKLENNLTKPKRLFSCIGRCDVLALGR